MIGSSQRSLPDNTQQSQETDIRDFVGIQTHSPSKWTALGCVSIRTGLSVSQVASLWWADIIFTTNSSPGFIFGKLQPVIMAAMLVARLLPSECIPHKAHTFVHVLSSSDKIRYKMSIELHWVSDSYMKIVTVQAMLSSGVYMNIWASCPHLLPHFGETSTGWHKKMRTFEKPNKNWRNPKKKIYWQK